MDKTYVPKGQIAAKWHLIDADGKTLGRLATEVATLLIGKQNVDYTPGVVMEDHVVVINAEKIFANLTRQDEKIYYHHTMYPGGLKAIDYKTQMATHPERILRAAVRGMLPKNRLTARFLDNLKIYAGSEHPHVAQDPQPYVKAK